VWYSDAGKLAAAEKEAARFLATARKDVHAQSLDTLRARVAENPRDGEARKKFVDAALKAGAMDEAVEVGHGRYGLQYRYCLHMRWRYMIGGMGSSRHCLLSVYHSRYEAEEVGHDRYCLRYLTAYDFTRYYGYKTIG
jgi:hypothetical protein